MAKLWLIVSAISGLLAVGLGAFGAHGLKGKVSASLLSAFQTGTHYQMFHTLALMGLAILLLQLTEIPKALMVAASLWVLGTCLFSGSLYALAMGGPSWLGPLTPLGGLLLMLGWLALIIGVWSLN